MKPEKIRNQLRILLKMLPIDILREIAYKKNIKYKARRKEDLIEEIVEKGSFDSKDFEGLKKLVKLLQEEKEPIAQYILKVSQINISELKSKLEDMPAKFDDSGKLISEGYEILEYRDNESLRFRKWRLRKKYYLDERGNVAFKENIDYAKVVIDLTENVVLIRGKYPAARNIKKELTMFGAELQPVGLLSLEREEANHKFQEFINRLEYELRRSM